MKKNKTKQGLMAIMLSVIMVIGIMPVSAFAETGTLPIGASGEIIAFEALGTDIAAQGVPLGTQQTELKLPDTLTATVQLATSQEAPIPDSGEADAKPDSAETVSESAVIDETYGTKTGGSEGDEIASPSGAEPAEDDGDSPGEVTVPLPVTWTSSPGYDSETAGTYHFTPKLPEGIALASGVEVPIISITVEAAVGTDMVTAFDALPDDIRWQNTIAPEFPEALGCIVAGEGAQIPVTWDADHNYNVEYPVRGLYVFTAVLEEGCEVADGIELPRMTVYIPQTVGVRMARMAGGGTTGSPLEITTAAQLAEIAELVNAGRLETFLFNNSAATVYLQLQNDLDLSGYGASYNGGKGWVPVGTTTNPFKGHFDGGGGTISGLYINHSTNSAGLFGSIDGGSVQNLLLSNAYVLGASETGGIAGSTRNATVKNCGVTGSVMGSTNVGGVVGGLFLNGKVEHCYSTGSVISTNDNAGGIAGNLLDGTSTVRNCYSTAVVEGKQYVGGIAGYIMSGTEMVTDCAALGPSIRAVVYKGRVAGQNSADALSGNAAYKDMTGGTFYSGPSEIDGEDITAAQIKEDGTIGGRFTAANGWTVANGYLPGFGSAADLPPYIVDRSDSNFPGAGTSENPYQISTAAQLAKLAELVNSADGDTRNAYNAKHYKLTSDIDLSVYNADNTGFNGGKGWIPIGGYYPSTLYPFNGVFDGGGYSIKGLYLNNNYMCSGLFGVISNGTVKNLGVVDAYIRGESIVGGIAAMMIGTMENCFVTGIIGGTVSVGGFIGDFNSPSSLVKNCYSTAKVTGTSEVGGIVGRSNMGCVVNSYATGTVTGTSRVGGVVGRFYGVYGSEVKNCIALNPSISGGEDVSRVVGSHGGSGVFAGNHAYSGMTVTVGGVVQSITDGTADNKNGLNKMAGELQTISGFPSGFGAAPWTYTEKMLPGLGGKVMDMPLHLLPTVTSPFGGGDGSSAEQAYEISTAAQLAKLAELVSSGDETTRDAYSSKYYKLMENIDLSAYGKSYDGGKGWTPIGRVINREIRWFNGKFDGNGKVITGLFINRPDENNVGLFGYAHEADLKNIAVAGANINGKGQVGGVAGTATYGTVQKCYIGGIISGAEFVGGIVGAHAGGTLVEIQNCRSDASVSGNGERIGGIVGSTAGVMENCYATGSVSGGTKVGGIAGAVTYAGAVRNCVALNPGITATGTDAGRVVGGNEGALTNNYAFSGMKVNGNIVTDGLANNSNGTDLIIARANTASFWATEGNWNTSAWDTAIWTIADNKLPVLTLFPAGIQSGDGSVYLTERDMANAIFGSIESPIYNGSQQLPTLIFDGATLVKDTDYTVDITSSDGAGTSAGTKAGEVTITVTGKGNFKGTQTGVTYTIQPKTLTEDMLTVTEGPFTYTGTPHTVDVTVTDGTTLAPGADYDVTYSDNTGAGEASVSVTGKGNYTGTASKNFTIAKAAAPTITWPTAADITYGSALLESALAGGSTEYGSFKWSTPETIPTAANSGYEVIFTPSAATVNNYEAISPTTETVQITVTPKSISGLTIDAIGPITYTGVAQTPTVTVKDGVTALALGADYDVTYSDNTGAGEASVSVTGKGNYTGTISKNFTIEKRPVTVKADDKSMRRGGTLPTFTYTVDGQLSGETALVGTPTLTCAADGKTAGSYPIAVDLTGVRYTANYTAAIPGSADSTLLVNNPPSGGSGGSSSSGSDTTTTAPEKRPDQPVTSEIPVTATAGQDGTAGANISDKAVTEAIAKAQEEAKKLGKTANGIGVDLNVNMPESTSSLNLTLSQNVLQSLVNAGVTSLTINSGIASLGLDLEALKEIQRQGTGSLTITIKPVQNLSGGARAMIGTRPVYDVTISYIKDGKTVNITSLDKGGATLSFPYTPDRNEAVGYLFGVYVDSEGNAIRIPGSVYDVNSGSILLGSNHFSVYGVGYQSPSEKYTDIASHWAKESIDYAVGRGLFSGTTDIAFSPNIAMSRGMLVTVLGRLSDADVSVYKTSSFTDVALGKYYLPHIEWAYQKGIVGGIGNGKFAPERAVTREEIALILQNYAKATGYKLPVTREASTYADASGIGSGYKTAVTAMQRAGIVTGGSGNKFNPKTGVTRAEVAAMLYRYIKLTIDPATARGWAKNDAGQYLYYKDGKALTGTQTIGGVKYYFCSTGALRTGWVKDGGNWRYYSGNKLLTGRWDIGSENAKKTYYFDTSGNMISGK